MPKITCPTKLTLFRFVGKLSRSVQYLPERPVSLTPLTMIMYSSSPFLTIGVGHPGLNCLGSKRGSSLSLGRWKTNRKNESSFFCLRHFLRDLGMGRVNQTKRRGPRGLTKQKLKTKSCMYQIINQNVEFDKFHWESQLYQTRSMYVECLTVFN